MTTGTIGRQYEMAKLGKIDAVRATLAQTHAEILQAISKAAADRH